MSDTDQDPREITPEEGLRLAREQWEDRQRTHLRDDEPPADGPDPHAAGNETEPGVI